MDTLIIRFILVWRVYTIIRLILFWCVYPMLSRDVIVASAVRPLLSRDGDLIHVFSTRCGKALAHGVTVEDPTREVCVSHGVPVPNQCCRQRPAEQGLRQLYLYIEYLETLPL